MWCCACAEAKLAAARTIGILERGRLRKKHWRGWEAKTMATAGCGGGHPGGDVERLRQRTMRRKPDAAMAGLGALKSGLGSGRCWYGSGSQLRRRRRPAYGCRRRTQARLVGASEPNKKCGGAGHQGCADAHHAHDASAEGRDGPLMQVLMVLRRSWHMKNYIVQARENVKSMFLVLENGNANAACHHVDYLPAKKR